MSTSDDQNNVKDEYELWKKNLRYMYEYISETGLIWPSLTIQWLPSYNVGEFVDAKLLLGTHTSGEDKNYLKVAATQLPNPRGLSSKSKINSKLKINQKFETPSEINRARFMPQASNIVAAIGGNGEVDFFDLSSNCTIRSIRPHSENGYGLSWNPHLEGLLLTGSDDKRVVLTDFKKLDSISEGRIEVLANHEDVVNDVKWHPLDANIFASVSDDENLLIYDYRSSSKPSLRAHNAQSKGLNLLAFSPYSRNLLATGSGELNIDIFDLRRLTGSSGKTRRLHTMMGHGDAITCMEFSPRHDGFIASGSQDRRVIIWDLSRIGEEQAQEDAEDGCPEIFMMHAGHTGAITDLNWCPYADWTLATAADDNIVHLWQVSDSLTKEKKFEVDIEDLE